jgi:hypothetical protein
MHSRGAGSNDDPIDGKITDIIFDQILSRIRAEVTVIPGYLYSGKSPCKTGELLAVHSCRDIGSAMTDVDTDFLLHK